MKTKMKGKLMKSILKEIRDIVIISIFMILFIFIVLTSVSEHQHAAQIRNQARAVNIP